MRWWPLFEKHQEVIRSYLQPASRFARIADPWIADLRQRHDRLVGLLIRQTDYRVWNAGRYFGTGEQYRRIAQGIVQRFGPDVGIVVACDEPQPDGLFDGLPVHFCTGAAGLGGHYVESF
ncbi:MAG: hypothetical protein JJU36_12660, partial [Phycisphaeraceae bacterium]|nr:hypothetical protein [Phycisphaeraceae bacterium]